LKELSIPNVQDSSYHLPIGVDSSTMEHTILFFLNGLFIGVSIAAPVGPIGLLCIRRTISGGMRLGFASGLGAALADTFYGIIAAFGLSTLADTLMRYEKFLHVFGGAFLIFLGFSTFLSKIRGEEAKLPRKTARSAFASTFVLTLTNPMTILAFAAIFSGFGLFETSTNYISSSALVLGVFLGSTAWWLTVSGVIGLMRHKVNIKGLRWINRIAGLIFIILGIGLIFQATSSYL
jgi:threonine/homoserine/homoserine lactone efflux protein